MKNSLEELMTLILKDPVARHAAQENELRHKLSLRLEKERLSRKLTVADLAEMAKTTQAQVNRVLHKEVGGDLKLATICQIADILGMKITVSCKKYEKSSK